MDSLAWDFPLQMPLSKSQSRMLHLSWHTLSNKSSNVQPFLSQFEAKKGGAGGEGSAWQQPSQKQSVPSLKARNEEQVCPDSTS